MSSCYVLTLVQWYSVIQFIFVNYVQKVECKIHLFYFQAIPETQEEEEQQPQQQRDDETNSSLTTV